MANPALNQKTFAPEKAVAWRSGGPDRTAVMTVDGTIARSLFLLAILIAGATAGWIAVDPDGADPSFPAWILIPALVGLGLAFLTIFRPRSAPFTAPLYAAAQGVFVGAISAVYETAWDGIVLQAIALTMGVFLLMLVLYTSRTIRATPRFQMGVMLATGSIFLVYMFSFVLNLFGVDFPFIHDTGPTGIIISLVIVGVAALNLILDFHWIEEGAKAGAPTYMSWFCGFGLLVTLVWLYLEILRLLGNLRS
jgi:uncharacterized YccA/Bax inhibitor family protein